MDFGKLFSKVVDIVKDNIVNSNNRRSPYNVLFPDHQRKWK